MHKPNTEFNELENALLRLMPAAVSSDAQERMDTMLDDLAGDSKIARFDFRKVSWSLGAAGIAAAVAVTAYFSIPNFPAPQIARDSIPVSEPQEIPHELVFLSEADRVEGVSDDGLFVDSGGSAVRKVRIRVVEESQIRDEETGIIVMLTEPREEMYMVPVNTF